MPVLLSAGSFQAFQVILGALSSSNRRPQSLHFKLPIYLNSPGLESVSTSVFIDSGAEENLMDEDFTLNWGVPLQRLDSPVCDVAVDGWVIAQISHRTSPIHLTVSGNHQEELSFVVIKALKSPIILGHPWLAQHSLTIDWAQEWIMSWCDECHVQCLRTARAATVSLELSPVTEEPDLTGLPPPYHSLYEDNDTPPPEPKLLILRERIITSVTWEIQNKILEAQREEPDPRQSPDRCLYVPRVVRSAALAWGHNSRFACHPGARRIEMLLRQHFWWPGLTADVKEFVATCYVFTQAVHLIGLPKLPSALELLLNQVFRVHGIPLDIVSDRGPQFVSAVWHAFGKALGTNMSLTSRYHPESNGQAERANQLVEETLRCMAAK
ncbi:hypothetical protein AOLI_G00195000 [Acnodon oligacanthus]